MDAVTDVEALPIIRRRRPRPRRSRVLAPASVHRRVTATISRAARGNLATEKKRGVNVNAEHSRAQRTRGAMATAPRPAALDALDASLAPLLTEEDNVASFVAAQLSTKSSAAVAEQLSAGVQTLGSELGAQVSERYEELLAEVHAVQTLESKVLRSNERVDALVAAVRRIRAQCREPYDRLRAHVTQLERMQESAELLRRVQRLLYLCRRLREGGVADDPALAPAKLPLGDLPRAAVAVDELEAIVRDGDFSGIDVVDAELPFVRRVGGALRVQADALLAEGVRDQKHAKAGTALQVFFHLSVLPEKVQSVAASVGAELRASLETALARGGAGGGAAAALWARVESAGESVVAAALQLHALHRVLLRKRDPLTQTLFASLVAAPPAAAAPAAAPAPPAATGAIRRPARRPTPGTEALAAFAADAEKAVPWRTGTHSARTHVLGALLGGDGGAEDRRRGARRRRGRAAAEWAFRHRRRRQQRRRRDHRRRRWARGSVASADGGGGRRLRRARRVVGRRGPPPPRVARRALSARRAAAAWWSLRRSARGDGA